MPKLFSYGTLQQEDVQLATLGRRLSGVADALVGYRQAMTAIQDPEVVRTSGKTHHPIVAFTGTAKIACRARCSRSPTPSLPMPTHTRWQLMCASRRRSPRAGVEAWVYVDARGKPPSA